MKTPCLLALLAIVLCACDTRSTQLVVAGGFQPSGTSLAVLQPAVVVIQPQSLVFRSVPGFGCPLVPPFATTFQVVVEQPAVNLFLDRVTIQFFDVTGFPGASIPFLRNDLASLFGPTLIRSATARSFPFTQRFGCFSNTPTTLSLRLVLVDEAGRSHESTLTAPLAQAF